MNSSPRSVSDLFGLISGQYNTLKNNPLNKKVKTSELFNSAVNYVYELWGTRFNIPSASDLKSVFARSRSKKHKQKPPIGVQQEPTTVFFEKPKVVYSLEDQSLEDQITELGLNPDNY